MFFNLLNPVIPIIELKGIISQGGNSISGKRLNIDALQNPIKKAFATSGAKEIVLDINCPGGSPTQSELIANAIVENAKQKGIKVHAFVQDVAASGGYWLACAADEITTAKTSLVGSIGVISSQTAYVKLAQRVGVELREFTAGANKSRIHPLKPLREEDELWMRKMLESAHSLFKAWVLERRGGIFKQKSIDPEKEAFTADIWFGEQAKSLGLTDGIGGLESTMTAQYGPNVKFVRVNEGGILSSFFNSRAPSSEMGAQVVRALHELIEYEALWEQYNIK